MDGLVVDGLVVDGLVMDGLTLISASSTIVSPSIKARSFFTLFFEKIQPGPSLRLGLYLPPKEINSIL